MRVAIRKIYYKAVTPSCDIVDMPENVWRQFLYGDTRTRVKLACSLLGQMEMESHVREIAWIPLSDQDKLVEKK